MRVTISALNLLRQRGFAVWDIRCQTPTLDFRPLLILKSNFQKG